LHLVQRFQSLRGNLRVLIARPLAFQISYITLVSRD